MAISIGINPLTWSNDDLPELGQEIPLEACLAEAKQAGYEGMELGHKFPRTAAALGPLLAGHGLRLVSGWHSGRLLERSVEQELEALRAHAELLSTLGAEVVIFAETTGAVHGDRSVPLSRRPRLDADGIRRFGEALTRVAEHTRRLGLELVYHHHMGTVIEAEAEIDALMAASGEAAGLLLDTGHLGWAGGDPLGVIARHGSRIRHVHLKDLRRPVLERAVAEGWPFLEAVLEGVFTVPGDGCVDYRAVLGALAGQGYDGWLVVEAEQDPAKAHPLTYARMGFEHVSRLAGELGLR